MANIPVEAGIRHAEELVSVAKFAYHRFGFHPYWRGQAEARWQLEPTLYRAARRHGYDDVELYERSLTNDFVRFAPSRQRELPPLSDTAAWICLMRHHGLPSRLLDWSGSGLVAAWFANQNPACDADLWAINPAILNSSEGGEHGMLSLRSGSTIVRNIADRPFKDLPAESRVLFVIAPEVVPRLLAQQACFTLHGDGIPLESRAGADQYLLRFRIGAQAKRELSNQLQLLGISRMSLFPDLDSLAITLEEKRFGGPKPNRDAHLRLPRPEDRR